MVEKAKPCIVCHELTLTKISTDPGGGLLVGESVCEGEKGITAHGCQEVRKAGGLVTRIDREKARRDELSELPLAA